MAMDAAEIERLIREGIPGADVRIEDLRGDGEVEVRWAAIPNSWKQPVEGIFKEETMRSLSDLGHQLGATPEAWHTEAP